MRIPCLAGLILTACAHPDAAVAPSGSASDFFATFSAKESSVNLALTAPYDTIQLHPTVRFADGTTVPDSIVYTPSDSTITVTPGGLVTAKFVTTTVATVTASVKHRGQTRTIVVRVQVRQTVPPVRPTGLTIRTVAGAPPHLPLLDTTALGGQTFLELSVSDRHGAPIPNPDIVFDVRSSDTTIAAITQEGFVTARKTGHVTFYMTTNAYGAHLVDSLPFTITAKQYGGYTIHSPTNANDPWPSWIMSGDTVRIAAGGDVEWTQEGTVVVDILFADTTRMDSSAGSWVGLLPASGRGNITALGVGNVDPNDGLALILATTRARRFPVVGTYPFTVAIHDPSVSTHLNGVIVVCPNDAIVCDH